MKMATGTPASEGERQAALLRLLWAPASADATSDDLRLAGLAPSTADGLAAHRRHAQASARRALSAAYPTVSAMLGDKAMATLAAALWRLRPPERGDLGEWGGALAEHLATLDELRAWPWLPDTARLDWARHRCERSPALPLDADSLHRLRTEDPAQLALVLQPHVAVLRASWPVHGLWLAHQLPAAQRAAAADFALQEAKGQGQAVVLWWSDAAGVTNEADAGTDSAGQPGVQQALLNPPDAAWMASLLSPDVSLGPALSQAPAAFNFSAWFTQALRRGWLQGARHTA
jgi:hypothetical protein